MEEFDDNRDVLEDIKALETVLTHDNVYEVHKNNDLSESNCSTVEFTEFIITPPLKHLSPFKSFHEQSQKSDNIINNVYINNTNLICSFKLAIEMISIKLEECIKRQQEVDYQVQLISKGGKANWKIHYANAGMPYFKDEKFFPSPMNEDTKQKKLNSELSIIHLRRPTRWTGKDRNIVKIAVRAQAANEAFEKMVKKTKENININNQVNECVPPKDLLAMVGPLGSKEFDWMKISAIDLKGRHTSNECRVIWNILLHPEINSSKWTRNEDTMLQLLAKSYKCKDWDRISQELYSNRSAYVSFIRYNTLFGTTYKDISWTVFENDLLTKCIEKQKFGDLIPWSRISIYLNTRTKTQIYSHWKYNLDPSVKKGRFTSDEDQLLLDSVSKFGTNFPRISAEVIPYRTSVQLSGRFRLLMLKTNRSYNSWTISDDRQLLQLHEEFGAQWSMIANIMKRDRTYLRHRYTVIKRHICKGTKLTSIPRKYQPDCKDGHNDGWTAKITCDQELSTSIDIQLIKYFQSIQAAKAKPGRKPTYHTADQLEAYTKKLYNILKKLNIKFIIPDNLNSFNISTKDKELLVSLKNYCDEKLTLSSKIIEQHRKKMFGDINLNNKLEHFIPPAPFGLFRNRVSKSSSNNTKTNLISNTCHIDLIMDFQTPDNVVKVLTTEENIGFDKLQSFIGKKYQKSAYFKRFEKIHLQQINSLNNADIEKPNPLDEISEVSIYCPNNDNNKDKNMFVQPCHSTLIGYQSLLVMKDLFSHKNIRKDNLELNGTKLTDEGRKAFSLFKTRLLCLLKYPIIMAHLSPFNYIEKNSHSNKINNIFNYLHDEDPLYSNEPVSENNSEKNNYLPSHNEEKLPDTQYEIKYDPTPIFSTEQSFTDEVPPVTDNLSNCKTFYFLSVNFDNTKQEQEN